MDSASSDPFEEISHSWMTFHHRLMKQEKSDEAAGNPLLERWDELKKDRKIQP